METDAVGFSRAIWGQMAQLGWLGMMLPQQYGGAGLTLVETVLLLEELGRALLPSPYVPTAVIAAPLLLALGSEAQRTRWLPRIATGDLVASVALVEAGSRDEWAAPSMPVVNGRVSGVKRFVPFAAQAQLILATVHTAGGEPVLAAIEPDPQHVRCTRHVTLDAGHLYAVELVDTPAEPIGEPVGAAAALTRARQHGAVAALAAMVGAAERALEMTLEYARTRQQFGQAIGSFQAVAHRCVDMRSDIDALRWLVYQAAWSLAHGRAADLEVSAAKAYGNDALQRIFMHAHQVHGAIGFSTECDLQLFTRRAKAAELSWGSTSLHREQVARAMGL
jgi:alkylation response protein AidB-like acyl-CoA dehydrogenase